MSGQASTGISTDDNDFQFLGVDRAKVLKEAPPYDGKKSCWVPDEKEGYVAAEIESTKGEIVCVRTVERMEVTFIHILCLVSFLFQLLPTTETKYGVHVMPRSYRRAACGVIFACGVIYF